MMKATCGGGGHHEPPTQISAPFFGGSPLHGIPSLFRRSVVTWLGGRSRRFQVQTLTPSRAAPAFLRSDGLGCWRLGSLRKLCDENGRATPRPGFLSDFREETLRPELLAGNCGCAGNKAPQCSQSAETLGPTCHCDLAYQSQCIGFQALQMSEKGPPLALGMHTPPQTYKWTVWT